MTDRKLLLLLLLAIFGATAAAAEMTATTAEGKKVTLHDNGTWSFAKGAQKEPAGSGKYGRSTAATEKIDILRGKAAVFYDPLKWRNLKEPEPGRFELTHKDGDAYALVIAERMQMSLESLRNIAINNAREAAPDIRVVAEEKRLVNGSDILLMQTAGTIQGMRIVYVGYYFTGKQGSVQVITFTGENLLDDFRTDLEEFLNGFQLVQQ